MCNRRVFYNKRFISFVKIFLIFLFVLFSSFSFSEEDSCNLVSLKGEKYTLKELFSHPKLILMFWSSWCYFCKITLQRLSQEDLFLYPAKFFFIDIGERKPVIEKFVKENKIDYFIQNNIILDKCGVLQEKFNIIGVPTFLFIKEGKIIYRSYFLDRSIVEEVFNEN